MNLGSEVNDWTTKAINLDHKEKLAKIPKYWMVKKPLTIQSS